MQGETGVEAERRRAQTKEARFRPPFTGPKKRSRFQQTAAGLTQRGNATEIWVGDNRGAMEIVVWWSGNSDLVWQMDVEVV